MEVPYSEKVKHSLLKYATDIQFHAGDLKTLRHFLGHCKILVENLIAHDFQILMVP